MSDNRSISNPTTSLNFIFLAPRTKLIWKLNSFQTRGRASNGHGNGESLAGDDDEIEPEFCGRLEDLHFKKLPLAVANDALTDLTWLDDDDIVD